MSDIEHFPLVDRLHTDVLEEKYGPIHAEVLRHDDEVREALLRDQSEIARTYALTFFSAQSRGSEIQEIDRIIKEGGAIGKTFREFGYAIRKNVIDVYLLETTPWLKEQFKVKEGQSKARLSEFLASKEGGVPVVYGTVMEAYTPDFRPPEINDIDLAQVSAPIAVLEQMGVSREDIWSRIGRNNDWAGIESVLTEAKKLTTEGINYYHQLVAYYLHLHR